MRYTFGFLQFALYSVAFDVIANGSTAVPEFEMHDGERRPEFINGVENRTRMAIEFRFYRFIFSENEELLHSVA